MNITRANRRILYALFCTIDVFQRLNSIGLGKTATMKAVVWAIPYGFNRAGSHDSILVAQTANDVDGCKQCLISLTFLVKITLKFSL